MPRYLTPSLLPPLKYQEKDHGQAAEPHAQRDQRGRGANAPATLPLSPLPFSHLWFLPDPKSEKRSKVPAAIAKAGRDELQKMLMDTLKKLKVRDKKLAGARAPAASLPPARLIGACRPTAMCSGNALPSCTSFHLVPLCRLQTRTRFFRNKRKRFQRCVRFKGGKRRPQGAAYQLVSCSWVPLIAQHAEAPMAPCDCSVSKPSGISVCAVKLPSEPSPPCASSLCPVLHSITTGASEFSDPVCHSPVLPPAFS